MCEQSAKTIVLKGKEIYFQRQKVKSPTGYIILKYVHLKSTPTKYITAITSVSASGDQHPHYHHGRQQETS